MSAIREAAEAAKELCSHGDIYYSDRPCLDCIEAAIRAAVEDATKAARESLTYPLVEGVVETTRCPQNCVSGCVVVKVGGYEVYHGLRGEVGGRNPEWAIRHALAGLQDKLDVTEAALDFTADAVRALNENLMMARRRLRRNTKESEQKEEL